MLASKFSNLRLLKNKSIIRLLSTEIHEQTENVGPIEYKRLTGADRGVVLYGLNSPRDRNALGHELVQSMREVNHLIREDTKVSVVILHSTVPGIFCAGANLKERFKLNDEEVAKFVRRLRETFIEVEDLPMPTIAAVEGAAVGGGLELALACDIRIAADSAKLGLVETGRGLIPGAGGTQRLPRVIHPNIAKELIFTSRIVSGKEAKELGIVNHVVPQNENKNAAFEKAMELAREIIVNAPVALRCAKQAINEGVQLTIKDGYEIEQKWYEVNVPTKDRQEGMISFMEKRKPVYQGH
ncbi:hypothetical protein JYU34_013177 [Plutella xylostella]|uniref:Uncharacterized protein n=1 Tax=Plutella xylostella TaxID=51655 RepID=A0ABQ7QD44_PLUXY|nr:hypothetical protein JYU34_013177 [Plutella xylostella]